MQGKHDEVEDVKYVLACIISRIDGVSNCSLLRCGESSSGGDSKGRTTIVDGGGVFLEDIDAEVGTGMRGTAAMGGGTPVFSSYDFRAIFQRPPLGTYTPSEHIYYTN